MRRRIVFQRPGNQHDHAGLRLAVRKRRRVGRHVSDRATGLLEIHRDVAARLAFETVDELVGMLGQKRVDKTACIYCPSLRGSVLS
ncbi:MAG: hypothetical protein OEN51_13080, partial [Gammaproteobacteria bacterium]|nr:hypothetical protein [Gammaproteobacteria bacterium]